MSTETSSRRYVPPHLRNRPATATAVAGPSRIEGTALQSITNNPQSNLNANDVPLRQDRSSQGTSRTPWSTSAPAGPSRYRDDLYTAGPSSLTAASTGKYEPPGKRSSPIVQPSATFTSSSAPPPRPSRAAGQSLFVFGDSFIGPMKLLSEENVKYTTFKGASAKGLNNPNSVKQVSNELLPALNQILAPPPYVYYPSAGRFVLLVFGNVDLQINYLWQLQNKKLSSASFPDISITSDVESEAESTNLSEEGEPSLSDVLAKATETAKHGPALGPELFVETVVRAYTSWLDREVVNGPVGQRIRENLEAAAKGGRKMPGKVLISGALPPLIEDPILSRIPEKYVERLEEEHEKAQEKLSGWRSSSSPKSETAVALPEDVAPLESGISTIPISDRPITPVSSSSISSQPSSMFDESSPLQSSLHSTLSDPPSPTKSIHNGSTKTSIDTLLLHNPPLCNLPTRVSMTNQYNDLLRTYCAKYPEIFTFIDITAAMLSKDIESGWKDSKYGEVDRVTWACPVDPTNIHPVWEMTLPLWLEELKVAGVPTEGFVVSEDVEKTWREYELDKKRRTAASCHGQGGDGDIGGGGLERVKIRDE